MLFTIVRVFLLTLTFSNVIHFIRNYNVYRAMDTEYVDLKEACELCELFGSKYVVLRCFYNVENLLIDGIIPGLKHKRCAVIETAPGISYVYGKLEMIGDQLVFNKIKVVFTADKQPIRDYLSKQYRKEFIACGLFIILMVVVKDLLIPSFLT